MTARQALLTFWQAGFKPGVEVRNYVPVAVGVMEKGLACDPDGMLMRYPARRTSVERCCGLHAPV